MSLVDWLAGLLPDVLRCLHACMKLQLIGCSMSHVMNQTSVYAVCMHLQAMAEVRRGRGKTDVTVAILALLSYISMSAVLVRGILCDQGSNQ